MSFAQQRYLKKREQTTQTFKFNMKRFLLVGDSITEQSVDVEQQGDKDSENGEQDRVDGAREERGVLAGDEGEDVVEEGRPRGRDEERERLEHAFAKALANCWASSDPNAARPTRSSYSSKLLR